jgi:signal transduction histidine kinase
VAEEALTTIAETGRQSLQEMRRIVRTLRSDTDGGTEVVSAPKMADVPALV